MAYPPCPGLLTLATEDDFRNHYRTSLCGSIITTFDGHRVHFAVGGFNHAFYTSADRRKGDKSVFSLDRAQRMDWIAWALGHPGCHLKQAWINNWGTHDPTRRLCIAPNNYCVWVQFPEAKNPYFITAFEPEPRTLAKLLASPAW